MAKINDMRTAFDVMYQNDYPEPNYDSSMRRMYDKIRDFCYRNRIQIETRSIPRRSIDVGYGYGYGVHSKYEYITDYPELDLTIRFEVMARIVENLEEMDLITARNEKELQLLEDNPELAEMYDKYLTFKALCEKK